MKRKLDPITNSSSCSYIVCVPKDYDLEKFLKEGLDLDYVEDIEKSKVIDELLSSKELNEYDNFSYFHDIGNKLKPFVVSGFDTSSDRGVITILYLEDLQDKIKGACDETKT